MCHRHDRASRESFRRFRIDPVPVLVVLALAGAAGAQVSPAGPEFQVYSHTTSYQTRSAVASDAAGNFVAAWQSDGSDGTDTDARSVLAQRYDAAGVPQGVEFQVNAYTTGNQGYPAIAAHAAGGFVVAWQSDGSDGTDTSFHSVQAQRFDAGGVPQGDQFQVNTYTSSIQAIPAIATDAAGSFVVAWTSLGSSGTDTSQFSAQAQRFEAAGAALGGEFQVNTYTTNGQGDVAIATDATGDFVVAWTSFGSSGLDTDLNSIQAQRYDGLFRDGFETGYTTRWSAVVP